MMPSIQEKQVVFIKSKQHFDIYTCWGQGALLRYNLAHCFGGETN